MENKWAPEAALVSQLGILTKDVNLYGFIDKTDLGKSLIGSQMDLAGRHLLNHRFGGGHLWWKELASRPQAEWPDVIKHLASDLPTKQGLPYIFDSSHVSDINIINKFGLKNLSSTNNWGMLNAFDLIAGSVAVTFSVYELIGNHNPYSTDFALVSDYSLVALTIGAGIVTSNPLLILSAIVKIGTIYLNTTASPFKLKIHPGYFDVEPNELLGIPTKEELLGIPTKRESLEFQVFLDPAVRKLLSNPEIRLVTA